jgi:hypothetical protein
LNNICYIAKKNYPYAVFGLGNPGHEYLNTRHNIGFTCIDHIAKRNGVILDQHKCVCNYGEFKIEDKTVLLGQPQTYMNLSGRAGKINRDSIGDHCGFQKRDCIGDSIATL